jgi:hypothetical protein
MARRERGGARVRPEMGRRDARALSPQVQAVSSRAAGMGDEARETLPPRSLVSRAAETAARPARCR